MNRNFTPRCYCLALLLALAAALTAKAQAGDKWNLSDTPQERRAAAVLDTIEKGDEAAVRQFFDEHAAPSFREMAPIEAHLEQFQRMKRDLAGMQVVGVDVPRPDLVLLDLKVGGGAMYRLRVELEPAPPNRVAGIAVVRAGDAPAAVTFSSPDDLDLRLRRMTEEDRFSGVVYAARGGRPVFRKAYGWADRAGQTANRPDTLFNLGSIDKQFTAVAILRLAQEGRLSLEDTVGKHLKGFAPGVADKVTVRQLLQHRSGLGDYLTDPKFNEKVNTFRTVNDYLALARAAKLGFEPGKGERYSNLGYVVLGGIIEAVTGRSYYDVVRDFVFVPAGMNSTGSFETGSGVKNMAVGYTRLRRGEQTGGGAPAQLIPNSRYFAPKGSPAGGGYSTADDLRRYVDALLDNRLLKPEFTKLMLTRFEPGREMPRKLWGFAGGAEGVNAAVYLNPTTRDVVIVLANLDMPVAEEVGEMVFQNLGKL